MRREHRELLEFLCGLVMLIIGLFMVSNNAQVTSTIISGEFTVFSIHINSLLIGVPLLIGLILGIIFKNQVWPKFVMGFGVLVILLSAVFSTTIRLSKIDHWKWFLYVFLIFLGAGLLCKALFGRLRKDRT